MTIRPVPGAVAALLFGALCAPLQAAQLPTPAQPVYGQAVRHDTSPALRDLVQTLPAQLPFEAGEREIPNQIFVRPDFDTLVPEYVPAQPGVQRAPTGVPAPPTIVSVNGINNIFGVLPPDTNGDVGRNYYIQYINLGWAIFDKVTGQKIDIPGDPDDILLGNTFWAGFGGPCQTNNSGDPVVLWDEFAGRWVFTQFTGSGTPRQCFAISVTDDPLGPYHRYEFAFPAFNDYPHVGIWVDQDGRRNGYYLAAHEFSTPGLAFVGASYSVVERDRMLAGEPAQFLRYPGLNHYGALPAHLEGRFKAAADTCAPFVHFDSATADYLFWSLCVDWANLPGSTLTAAPRRVDAGVAISNTVGVVDQPSNAPPLDAFPLNLMYRASARKFDAGAPTDLSLVINHTVNAGGGQGAVRWVHFDIGKATGTGDYAGDGLFVQGFDPLGDGSTVERIVDQGIYAPDGDNRWMGGISIDQSGNIGLGYTVASAEQAPEIRLTGRTLGDPAGTLRDETTCTPPNTGLQTSTSGRWGDYASTSVDPSDECTFWHTNEFYTVTASGAWNTRICSFRFEQCGLPDFVLINDSASFFELCGTTPADPQIDLRGAVLLGYEGAAALSTSGFPAGVTPSFSVNPIGPLPGTSVLTLAGASGLASGEYSGTVLATSGALSRSVDIGFGVSASAASGPALQAPGNGATGVSVRPTLSWAASPSALEYRVQVSTSATFTPLLVNEVVEGESLTLGVSLSGSTPYFWRVIPINYCGEGSPSSTASFTTGVAGACPVGTVASTLFQDDAESAAAGWVVSGTGTTPYWSRVAALAGTGMATTVWRAVNHPTVSDQRLTSPAIAVPAGSDETYLLYQTFHNLETDGPTGCWDAGLLEISTDGGTTFTQVPDTAMLTDPYTGLVVENPDSPISGQPGWCGSTPGASIQAVVDLSAYAGQTIRLRLRVGTDAFVAAPAPNGWFVDNILVRACQ
jgi:hypothetical protein